MFCFHLPLEKALPVPLSANRYYVDWLGNVTDSDSNPIQVSKNSEGEPVAWLCLWDGWKHYRVADLIAHAYKPVYLAASYWSLIKALPKDNDPNNIHPANLVWKFPIGLECRRYPTFAYIPGCSRYAINKEGDVINVISGKRHTPHKSNGYRCYCIKTDLNKSTSVGRYRLLALAWLDYPLTADKLDVNHLNGIRNDDRLENLEWATRKRNCDHAYQTGLRTDNHEVMVRNVLTNEIKSYYSLEDCARDLKIDGETIRLRVNTPGMKIYPGYLQFKRKNDSSEWRHVENPVKELYAGRFPIPIMAKNIFTGEVAQYENSTDAAKALGLCNGSIRHFVKYKKTSTPHYGYLFKEIWDQSEWPVFTNDQMEVFKQNASRNRPMVRASRGWMLKNAETGERKIYSAAEDLARDINVQVHCVLSSAANNKPLSNGKWWVSSFSLLSCPGVISVTEPS